MTQTAPEAELLRVEDVQAILSVSKTTAWELIRSGQLRTVRIKTKPNAKRSLVRVPREALDAFIQAASDAGECA